MRIDLSAIDAAFFFIRAVDHPDLGRIVQIAPQKNKHRWAADELHLQMTVTQFRQFSQRGLHSARDLSLRMPGG